MKNKKAKTIALIELILRTIGFQVLTMIFIASFFKELADGNENVWKNIILLILFFLGTLLSI